MGFIEYSKKIDSVRFDSVELSIESLLSLDQTIDELFLYLEKKGNPSLLETLCPYFGTLWPAARGLSEYLVQLGPSLLSQKSVLEIGCGLAIPSMVCAKLGAQVTATDFHPDILEFLDSNLRRNQIQEVHYVEADWQKEVSDLGTFDWVVGSDILYERAHPAEVSRALTRHLNPNGRLILADPGRPYLQPFVDEMKKIGFDHQLKIKNSGQEIFVFEFSLSSTTEQKSG